MMWFFPAGSVMRFTLSYSAITYLHRPIFFAKDLLSFHARAAMISDCLLSDFERAVLAVFLCAEKSMFPFNDAIVTYRIDLLDLRILSASVDTCISNTIF